jgi:hypothetical protein
VHAYVYGVNWGFFSELARVSETVMSWGAAREMGAIAKEVERRVSEEKRVRE